MATATAREDAGGAAAKDALFAALYDELHRLAQSHLRRNGGSLTISATTLLHEAYLDLAGRADVAFPDRNRFLGYASRAMRGLIVDYVRHRGASKRGGDLTFTSLEDHHAPPDGGSIDLERLGGALEELAAINPQLVAQRWLHVERAVEERTQSQPEGSIQFLHWRASDRCLEPVTA